MRTPKVKVTKSEVKDFPLSTLKIDNFYKDLLDYKNINHKQFKTKNNERA